MTADNTRRLGMRPALATASTAMILLACPALACAQDPAAPESDAATTNPSPAVPYWFPPIAPSVIG
ncbi:hypothetical protein MWU77_07320 [Rhodococcus sp. F64268]|uniref:hypothetical protein n=1 Tax=Rhodococcus sp. F64268 TaxID=2926402 RepID=UPI001FF1FC85|nr:hypothetical protein [Rhodococcus sp. F64268]MCK0090594.1 hypothetical protein [Rhodococcus sp. F64268]